MPWVLIPGALRRIRRSLKLDRKAAAKLLGLSEWTVHRHETDSLAPKTMRWSTVKLYANPKTYKCDPEAFVRWFDHDDEEARRKPRTKRTKDPAAPRIATLTERAKHEFATGIKPTISYGGEQLELVGNIIVKECMTAFAHYEGKRYAVEGIITETDYIPTPAAKMLGTKPGDGARCRIDREIVSGLPVYVTVFAPKHEHTPHLLDAHKSEKTVLLIVRVFVKPEEGDWKGFFIFEKKPVPRPWIFVVEDIVTREAAPA